MNIYLENEIDVLNIENYNNFIFDKKTYFYEKEYFIFKGINLGEKTPNINLVLKKLEEVYNTKFVLTEIECCNLFHLSTQVVAKNIRLTDLDLPILKIKNKECTFIKTDKYKIIKGNDKVNLFSNLIESISKGERYFNEGSYNEQIKILKYQLTELEINEINQELEKRKSRKI